MHLYLITRGIKECVDRWVSDCEAQYFPYKYHKDMEKGVLQLSMRPIQLWEICFPEDQLENVVRTLQITTSKRKNWCVKMLRKLLGAREIQIKECGKPLGVYTGKDMEKLVIGYKKDIYIDDVEQI